MTTASNAADAPGVATGNGDSSRTQTVPPHVQLIEMGTAFWVSRVVYAAAKLGLADHLNGKPMNAVELSPLVAAHAPSLHRFMRTLAGLGILTEGKAERFALTALGEA